MVTNEESVCCKEVRMGQNHLAGAVWNLYEVFFLNSGCRIGMYLQSSTCHLYLGQADSDNTITSSLGCHALKCRD